MAKREYNNEYPSVTQVINILRKPALENWFKVNTAKYCDEQSRCGRQIGTQVHDVICAHIEAREAVIETDYAEEVKNALLSFMKFKKEHPEFALKRAELALTHSILGYNGTIDALGFVKNDTVVMDWKTGKLEGKPHMKCYPEYLYQVAAYTELYHNSQSLVKVPKAYTVVIAKDEVGYDLYEFSRDELMDAVQNVFVPALSIWNFQKKQRDKEKEARRIQKEADKALKQAV